MESNDKNREQIKYIASVLKEQTSKRFKVYYTIKISRYGMNCPVVWREPSTTDIINNIEKYTTEAYNPDFLTVEFFTGQSRKVKKPLVSFKLKFNNTR